MFLTLFSTKISLGALGASDFGIFNLVIGLIAMLAFVNAALTVSSQRYLSFYLGNGDEQKINKIFSVSVVLHFLLGIIIVLFLEFLYFFFLEDLLNIPLDRLNSTKTIYQFAVISTFLTITSVPYDALINAHEDIYFDSVVGIFESILRVLSAYILYYVTYDKLLIYGFMIALSTILVRIIKWFFCLIKYKTIKFDRKLFNDLILFREMFSFASWNLFGALASLVKVQGSAILLNVFFGTIINASYAISNQIGSQLGSISENMLKAIRPQIIKHEGVGNRIKMLDLSLMASKYSFLIFSLLALPILFNIQFILKSWLGKYPVYTEVFSTLTIVVCLINLLTIGIRTAVQAIGKIQMYQAMVGSMLLLNLPLSYLFLYLGYSPEYVFFISIFVEVVAAYLRILFLRKLANLSVKKYFKEVIFKSLLPVLILIPFCFILSDLLNVIIFIDFIIYSLLFSVVYLIIVFYVSFSDKERLFLINGFKKITHG